MRKVLYLLPFAAAGWALCGLIMKYSDEWFGMEAALTLHASFGPLAFVLVSLWYFRLEERLSPLYAALFCGAFVFVLDLVVVALAMGVGLSMFGSFVGFWLPLLLILLLVWATGHFVNEGEAETIPPIPANLSHLS